jgi:6-phosphogluconolactonase
MSDTVANADAEAEPGAAATNGALAVYVFCAGSREILVFGCAPNSGRLTLEQTVAVPGADAPSPSSMPLAVAPDRRFLYAALREPPYQTSCFAIAPHDGHLTWLSATPICDPMAYIAVAPDGRTLLGASYKNGTLASYRLAPDGGIAPHWASRFENQPRAHCIIPGRHADVAYATVLTKDEVLPLRLDPATGALALPMPPVPRTPSGSGPRHLALHPTLDLLYVLNEHAGSLEVRGLDARGGSLESRQSLSLMPQGFSGNARSADLHVSPDGRLIFASVRSGNFIAACRIAADGMLSLIGTWPVCGSPRGFAITPDGRFLIAAGQTANVVAVYRVAPDGALAEAGTYPTPGNPNWVEILPRPIAVPLR